MNFSERDLRNMLFSTGLVSANAINDSEGFDSGKTLHAIGKLYAAMSSFSPPSATVPPCEECGCPTVKGALDRSGQEYICLNCAKLYGFKLKIEQLEARLSTPPTGDSVRVPREPTEAMQRAGAEYANYDGTEREAEHDSDATPDHIDMFVAARVYRVMLAAAPAAPGAQESDVPDAWRIRLKDSQYLVDSLDDEQAMDDMTNHDAAAIPLFERTIPQPAASAPVPAVVAKALAFLREKIPSHGTHSEELINAFDCIRDAVTARPEDSPK